VRFFTLNTNPRGNQKPPSRQRDELSGNAELHERSQPGSAIQRMLIATDIWGVTQSELFPGLFFQFFKG
jgi:hypothetical protein